MKRSKHEIVDKVKSMCSETPTDEELELLEDLDDSIPNEEDDWEQRYNDLDKSWRQKYMDRFNGKVDDNNDDNIEPEEQPKKYHYSDLFKED